jgi:hypothetical protein
LKIGSGSDPALSAAAEASEAAAAPGEDERRAAAFRAAASWTFVIKNASAVAARMSAIGLADGLHERACASAWMRASRTSDRSARKIWSRRARVPGASFRRRSLDFPRSRSAELAAFRVRYEAVGKPWPTL